MRANHVHCISAHVIIIIMDNDLDGGLNPALVGGAAGGAGFAAVMVIMLVFLCITIITVSKRKKKTKYYMSGKI